VIVAEARPADKSAHETVLFFENILKEDHEVTEVIKQKKGDHYTLQFIQKGEKKTESILAKSADKLLQDIIAEPKYN
jgi:hypothetical protein